MSYYLNPQKKEILRQELEIMLQTGVIEGCESSWAALVVLISKLGRSHGVCIDHRKLNLITLPVVFPLPRIDDLLRSTTRTRPFMSTLDLRVGYWQIPLRADDNDNKTVFITQWGLRCNNQYNFNKGSLCLVVVFFRYLFVCHL